jgi:hypothetical protein
MFVNYGRRAETATNSWINFEVSNRLVNMGQTITIIITFKQLKLRLNSIEVQSILDGEEMDTVNRNVGIPVISLPVLPGDVQIPDFVPWAQGEDQI